MRGWLGSRGWENVTGKWVETREVGHTLGAHSPPASSCKWLVDPISWRRKPRHREMTYLFKAIQLTWVIMLLLIPFIGTR